MTALRYRIAVLLMLLMTVTGFAQIKFSVAQSSSTFNLLAGASAFTWTTTTANDDEYSSATNIGFNFTYCGTTFTQFQASTNGFIRLGSGLTSATATDALNGTLRQIIAPLWQDLAVSATATDVTYQLSGSAPNQILTVEWNNVKWSKTATTANAQFQVKLYETSGVITFHYGTMAAPTAGAASIGLINPSSTSNTSTAGTFISLNIGGTAGSRVLHKTMALAFNAIAQAPDNNTLITFTPETGSAMSGAYTVGGTSPSFANPSDAALALNMRGISGAVTLNFRNGTYDDIFHLLKVTGQSASNTITLQEESGTVTLSPTYGSFNTTAPSATAGDAMIRLDGSQYVTIKNFYLTDNALNTSTTTKFDVGVMFAELYQYLNSGITNSGSRFNTLRSLRIDLNAQTGALNTGATGIRFGTVATTSDTSVANSYNTIVDCKIDDCWRSAIRFFGHSPVNPDRGNKITGDTGRTYVGNITITGTSTGDVRVIEAEDQYDLTIEKTDVQNVSFGGTSNTTSNVYGIVANLAGGSTDYLVGPLTIQNVNIYSLYNSSTILTTGFAVGISLNRSLDGATITIKNNKIYDIFTNGSGATRVSSMVLNVGPGLGTSTLNVFNNMIYNLRAPRGTTNPVVRGIDLQASAGGVINAKFYNNTISLTDSVPPTPSAHYSSGIYVSNFGNSLLDLQNNIISNTMSTGSGRATAIHTSANSNLLRLTNSSDKNIYYVGTTGTFRPVCYDGTTSFTTINDYIASISSSGAIAREKNSSYENPPFVGANWDVHLTSGTGTMAEGRANVLAQVGTDIDGNTRSASTPDIGADEGSFTAGDYAGPSVGGSISNVANSTSTTSYNITGVTITDASGVNTTAGTKPRMYYKKPFHANAFVGNNATDNGWKWVEANETSSPFSFTVDFSLLNLDGSSPVVANDTIYYFVVAQDLVGTPNVGAFPLAGFAATSVSAITSAPTSNYSFYISNNLSGTVTVGSGGTYPSLSGAGGLFAAINRATVTGNITAKIVSDLSEDGTNYLNQWSESGAGNYTVTIQPDTSIVRNISVTGSIVLGGSDRVTIDGRYDGSGRYLRFYNSGAITMLIFFYDATNCTVRNTTFEMANALTTSSAINFNTAYQTGNDNITIDSCVFRDRSDIASTWGAAITTTNAGGTGDRLNDNITISNNSFVNGFLGTLSPTIISIGEGNTNWTISGNSFYNTTGTTTVTVTGQAFNGIFIANPNGYFTVSGNYFGGSAANAGGSKWTYSTSTGISASFYAVRISSASSQTATTISNNVLKNIDFVNNASNSTTTATSPISLTLAIVSDGYVNVTGNTMGDTTMSNSIVYTVSGSNTNTSTNTVNTYMVYFVALKGSITNNTVGGISIVNNMTNTSSGTAGTQFSGIFAQPTGEVFTISGNKIGAYGVPYSIACTSGTALASTSFYTIMRGIYHGGTFGGSLLNNTIVNLAAHTLGTSANNVVFGAQLANNSAFTATGNVIANLEGKSGLNSTTSPSVCGLMNGSNTNGNIIANNRISGLTNATVSSVSPTVLGIIPTGQNGGGSIYNNIIYDLKSTATSSPVISGLYGYWGQWNVYNNLISVDNGANTNGATVYGIIDAVGLPWSVVYNSVRIGGSAATGALNSYGYYRSYPTPITLKNNIFVNERTNSGATGKHYAVGNNNTQTATVSDGWTSTGVDYNNYYSSTSSTTGLWSTTDYDFSGFKTISGADVNSSNAAVNFTSSTDLHLTGASLGDRNLGGVVLNGYTTDYDGDTRSTIKPYKGFDERTSNPLYMSLNLTALIEAMYDGSSQVMDTVKVYLATAGLSIVDSASANLSATGTATFTFSKPTSNTSTPYYLKLVHRNAIETWSAAAAAFGGVSYNYNMTTAAAQAFGSNLVLKSGKYCIYSGDVNQDGLVDLSDLLAIDNDNANFVSGYVVTDVNGDLLTDLSDLLVADNNNAAFVSKQVPSASALKANRERISKTKKELLNN